MGIVEATRKTDKMQRVYYALLCGGSWPYLSPKLNTNITMKWIKKVEKRRKNDDPLVSVLKHNLRVDGWYKGKPDNK
jgi:hypothetical protein